MVQIIFYGAVIVMGLQLIFGKIDESKLKPGVSLEEASRKNKKTGYLFLAIPVIFFILRLMLL